MCILLCDYVLQQTVRKISKFPTLFKNLCEINEKARKMVRNQLFLWLFYEQASLLDKQMIKNWYLLTIIKNFESL